MARETEELILEFNPSWTMAGATGSFSEQIDEVIRGGFALVEVLTGVAGVFLTLIYRPYPNLWAAGIVHGVLGSLAFYIVLKEDPGAAILRFLAGQ